MKHLWIVALAVLVLLVSPVAVGEEPHYLLEAAFAESEAQAPPVDADWQVVTLPHFTPTDNPAPRVTWYRIPVSELAPGNDLAVYLWRYSMNAEVWLNATRVGGGGSFEDPITRNWNRPFLYRLPETSVLPEQNVLYVRVAAYPGWGYLAPPIVGSYSELEPEYNSRFFWQITTNEISAVIALMVVIVAMTFWLSDRREWDYALFAALGVSWTIFSLSNFLQHSPVSAKTWWWLVHVSLDANVVLLVLFYRRLTGYATSIVDQVLAGLLVASMLFYLVLPLVDVGLLNRWTHAVAIAVLLALMVHASWRSFRQPEADVLVFTGALLLILVFAVHDFLMISKASVDLWRTQFFWLQFAAPIFMVSMMVMLARRYARKLQQERDTEHQVRLERERIYSDVHDDVGSKLLTLVYSAETESQAELAREALRETREIVSGAMSSEDRLDVMLEKLQAETRRRLESADVVLDWHVGEVGKGVQPATFSYHLQRILRELVSNVIRHAGASRVAIACTLEDHVLSLTCTDDGGGLPGGEDWAGVGMSGIQRRATDMGGTARWESGENGGCVVRVTLPLREGVHD